MYYICTCVVLNLIALLLAVSVHVGSVRQTATIVDMSLERLRTGDKSIVRFRFIKNPEYLKTGLRMVFREGRTKAVGTVTKLFPHVSASAQNTRQQRAAKKAHDQHHHHQLRPQNEPQKPSKRNRRNRNNPYPSGGSGGATRLSAGAAASAPSAASAGEERATNSGSSAAGPVVSNGPSITPVEA